MPRALVAAMAAPLTIAVVACGGKSKPAGDETRSCDEYMSRSSICAAMLDGGQKADLERQRLSLAESMKATANSAEARRNVTDACSRALAALRATCPDR